MLKNFIKFAAVLTGAVSLTSSSTSFSYKYKITANSAKTSDLLTLYEVKQDFISTYNSLVLSVNEKQHEKVVTDNLEKFVDKKLGYAKYENKKIVIIIGEGKGGTIEGDLKKNACDTDATNYRIFILDLLFS